MSTQLPNIHDAFFKQMLSDPELAGTFLREHLPADVMSLLGPEAPEAIPGSFVDEALQEHHSDLIFRVHLNTGSSAFAYVLMEHKSVPDKAARLQLLRYVVRLLSRWYRQNGRQLPLPPVLPLLAHQGPKRWKWSCEFVELFGTVPEPMKPYLPSFRHALVDLAPMGDHSLSSKVRLRAFLKALKYCRRADLPYRLLTVLADAPELDEEDLLVILTYLEQGPVTISSDVLHEALRRLVPKREERIMGGFAQPYFDKGKAEGIAEGIAEGEARGRAKILSRLLEKRFGALPQSIQQQIAAADVVSIEAWVDRALDAPDLRSVFVSN
jgi:predicted transposase YdaD